MVALVSFALLLAQAGPAAGPGPQIVWIDMAGTPAAAERAAQEEAGRLLLQLGLTVGWRHGAPDDVLDEGALAVIVLPRNRAAQRDTFVLGACNSRSGTPRAWIFLDSLRWALGLSVLDSPPQASRMGVALGRIVAHEVVHAVAPSLDHARAGLMSARLDRTALLGPSLSIDPATRRAVARIASEPPVYRASAAGVNN